MTKSGVFSGFSGYKHGVKKGVSQPGYICNLRAVAPKGGKSFFRKMTTFSDPFSWILLLFPDFREFSVFSPFSSKHPLSHGDGKHGFMVKTRILVVFSTRCRWACFLGVLLILKGAWWTTHDPLTLCCGVPVTWMDRQCSVVGARVMGVTGHGADHGGAPWYWSGYPTGPIFHKIHRFSGNFHKTRTVGQSVGQTSEIGQSDIRNRSVRHKTSVNTESDTKHQ